MENSHLRRKWLLVLLSFLISAMAGVVSPVIQPVFVFIGVLLGLYVILLFSRYNLIVAFWVYIAVLLFQLSQFSSGLLDGARWFLMFCVCLVAAIHVKKYGLKYSLSPLLIIGLGSYAMLTSINSYSISVSLLRGVSVVLLGLFLLLAVPLLVQQHGVMQKRRFIVEAYLLMSVFIVLSNAAFILLMPASSFLAGRFRGWFGNPNGFGAVCGVFIVPIVYQRIRESSGVYKISMLGVFLAALIELAATGSRNGVLSAIVSIAVLNWWQDKAKIFIYASLFFLVIVFSYYNNFVLESVVAFVEKGGDFAQGSGRVETWRNMWRNIELNFWFGSGFGVSDIASGYSGIVFYSEGLQIEKSNSYLGILEELGAVGALIMFVNLCVIAMTGLRKIVNSTKADVDNFAVLCGAIFCSGLVNAFFEAWLLAVGSFIAVSFWIFSSLLATPRDSEEIRMDHFKNGQTASPLYLTKKKLPKVRDGSLAS